MDQFLF